MIKETILLKNSIEDSKEIIESNIPIINCKIKNVVIDDESIITINWETREKEKIICKSELYKQKNRTKIITELEGNSTKAKNLFLEFRKALSNDSIAILDFEKVKSKNYTSSKTKNNNKNDGDYWVALKRLLLGMGIVAFTLY